MTTWSSAPGTCVRLIGNEGELCQTCGRPIVRQNLKSGAYALHHEGPSVAEKLHRLNEKRDPRFR